MGVHMPRIDVSFHLLRVAFSRFCLPFVALALVCSAAAQEERVMTLLPDAQFSKVANELAFGKKPEDFAYLLFRLPIDLRSSDILGAKLRLTQTRQVLSCVRSQSIKVFRSSELTSATWEQWKPGDDEVRAKLSDNCSGDKSIVDDADLKDLLTSGTGTSTKSIALVLQAASSFAAERYYYPSDPQATSENILDQPRLIIRYSVPEQRTPAARELSDGWANSRSSTPFVFDSLPASFVAGTATDEAEALKPIFTPAGPTQSKEIRGPEGNLYTMTGSTLYGASTAHRLLWQYTIGASENWRMTLSPTGRYLYAIGIFENERRFWAINTATGIRQQLPINQAVDLSGKGFVIEQFHSPVVAYHPEGADYVFVSANSNDAASLFLVRNSMDKRDPTAAPNLDGPHYIKGIGYQIAQPIISEGTTSSLQGKSLYVAVQTENGKAAIESRDVSADEGTALVMGPKFSVTANNDLWRHENPVLDGKDNLIFYDSNQIFLLPAKDRSKVLALDFRSSANLQLLFGPSGWLYSRNDQGQIVPIVPSYDASSVNEVRSPVDAQLTGLVERKTLNVKASGSIFLAPGFTVDAAGLECSAGVEQSKLQTN
jgi:hypothetical protein